MAKKSKSSRKRKIYSAKAGIGFKFIGSAILGFVGSNLIASMLRKKDEAGKDSAMPIIAPLAVAAASMYLVKDSSVKHGIIGGAVPSALLTAGTVGLFGDVKGTETTADGKKKTSYLGQALLLAGDSEAADPLSGNEYVISGDEDFEMYDDSMAGDEYVISGNDESSDPLA